MNDLSRGLACAVACQPACRELPGAGLGFCLTKFPPSPGEGYVKRMEGEESGFIIGCQNLRVFFLEADSDGPGGPGEKSSVSCGLATDLGAKSARPRSNLAVLSCSFRAAQESGI